MKSLLLRCAVLHRGQIEDVGGTFKRDLRSKYFTRMMVFMLNKLPEVEADTITFKWHLGRKWT